jgi:general stress protein YciG
MGKRVGRLGRERPPLDLEFDYFDGAVIRIHPGATDQVEAEFRETSFGIDLDEVAGLDLAKFDSLSQEDKNRVLVTMSKAELETYRALKKAIRGLIHPDDVDRYWEIGNKHGQQMRDRMADIKSITEWVLEESTDFRTGQSSGSTGGQQTTPPPSGDGSPSPEAPPTDAGAGPALTGTVVLPGSDLEKALVLERGRPDIQEIYLMEREFELSQAQEAREAQERDRQKLAEAGYAPAAN